MDKKNGCEMTDLEITFKNSRVGAGEIAQHLRTLATLSDDQSLAPSTHTGELSVYNSSSSSSDALFCFVLFCFVLFLLLELSG